MTATPHSDQTRGSLPPELHSKPPTTILGRWQQLIDGLSYSSDEFYQTLEHKFEERAIPDLAIGRVSFRQRGAFSDKQVFLRLAYREFTFDICASPIGQGAFFISYWHGFLRFHGSKGVWTRIGLITPILGRFIENNLRSDSYYYADTTDMFQQLAHHIILETVDEITSEASLPPLTEQQRKPLTKNLLSI